MEPAPEPSTLAFPVRTHDDVLRLSRADQARLAAWLADVSIPATLPPDAQRRRRHVLLVASAAAVVLVPWLAVLAATLPDRHRAHEWRLAWVGFDAVLVVAFAATAWFGWRSRQIVVTAFVVTATLLLCDAWFDIVLSWGSRGERGAILAAVVGEIPFAVFLLAVHHHLTRAMAVQVWHSRGRDDRPPPLHRLPLLLRPLPPQEFPAKEPTIA